MKTVVIVAAICLVGAMALSEEQKTKLKEYRDACITETGVESQVVDAARNGNYDKTNEKMNCFSACMLKKIKIMDEDGTLNEEMARKRAPAGVSKEQIDDVLNKCRGTTGANTCEKAGNMMTCFMENKTFTVFN